MSNKNKKAVILLSGGIDSATTAAYAIDDGYNIYAVTFFYGQKHSIEISFVKRLCEFLKINNHLIIDISEILDIPNIETFEFKIPPNHIKSHNRTRMT